jgi:hypothetical protein
MAFTATSQILEQGPNRVVMKFTGFTDTGTNETSVKKVDAQSPAIGDFLFGQQFVPGTSLVVADLWWNVEGMVLRMIWEATSNVELADLQGFGHWPLRDLQGGFGGLANPKTAGSTGSILFTTVGAVAGASYTVVLEMIKGLQIPLSASAAIELEDASGVILLEDGGGEILLE